MLEFDSTIHVPVLLLTALLGWLGVKLFGRRKRHSMRSVAILVLGDIGRSPRMMYHAQSFAENGFVTDLIGYAGSKPIPSLGRLPKVRIRHIPELPKMFRFLPYLVIAPIKVIHQTISILLCLLVWIDVPPEFIIVQNPPSIPTLALVQLVARTRGSKVIIDWHNLGYSILALRLGNDHILVRVAKWFESTFGYSAFAHLFVSRAMRDFLVKEWHLQGHKAVLYDRPPRHFHRSSAQETHELFCKLHPKLMLDERLRKFLPTASIPYSTILTHTARPSASAAFIDSDVDATYVEIEMPTLRSDRPAILVSSTSWTPDEDFSILLDALVLYEKRATRVCAESNKEGADKYLPKLLVIITGKGPLKEKYMNEIAGLEKDWNWVRCISLWLEPRDYPILLGSSDLGVCLHSSSSSLDLPMKVIDMFGCGLPVCAIGYNCLPELVKDGKNGLIFNSSQELASQLETVFLSFPNSSYLASLTQALSNREQQPSTPNTAHMPAVARAAEDVEEPWCTWEENWGRIVRPLILNDVNL
ncbi:mannosyltransferase [Agrocybe pediades]|nr:mannosyltransferase [Agrocybe pediades]